MINANHSKMIDLEIVWVIGIPVLLIANIPLYRWLFWKCFLDVEDFKESLYYVFRPDLVSWLNGELLYDLKQKMRVQFYFGLCLLALFIESVIFCFTVNLIAGS